MLAAANQRRTVVEGDTEERRRPMADGGDDHACVPGTDDCGLHLWVTGDINHRSKSAREEDGVVVEHVDFGQFAAAGQAPVGLTVEEGGLCGVVGVEPIFWGFAAQWGGELDGDAGSVKRFERMGYLRKKKPVGRLFGPITAAFVTTNRT